jgi:hypothetical protein
MSLSKGDLDIVSFNDSEIYDIQKTALLLDTDINPIFITPIIAYGEELTPGTPGSTLATATQFTIEDQIDTTIGPIVYMGNNTQNVIDILDGDIGAYVNSPWVTTSSELSAFFNLETVITGGTSESNVCVVTDNNGTVTSTYDAVYVGGRGGGSWTCPNGGTYNQTYTTTIYTYTGPLYLDEPITVTGTPYTDQNNDTGSLVSITIPTEYVFIQYSYSETDPALATLNNILTPAGKAALAGTSLDIQVKFLQESTAAGSSIPKLITPDSNIIPAINENYRDIEDAKIIIENQQTTIWETGMGYWPSGPIGSTKTDESDITNIINNPEWDTTTYNQLTAKSTITVASTGWENPERISISRLNLIPVLAKDKIFTQKTVPDPSIPGETVDINVLEPDSQVNLLEAVWTQWRYLQGITETVYGVPALTATADIFKDDPTATTFIPELTGFNLIENINSIYTTVSGLSDTATECCNTLSVQMTAISADLSEIKTDLYGTSLTGTLAPSLTGDGLIEAVNTLYDDLGDIIGGDLDNRYVNLSGDTLQGPLILSRFPQQDMEATPKKWITDNYMPLSNVIPTITAVNTLRLQDSPVHPLDAVSKEYLDCKIYNFEQTFPRIPDLDLRYINLTGDHMAGPLHYSHDTNIDYGTIPANAVDFDIDISFDNKTFQTLRVYRTDVVHNIKLQNPGNGKITSIRLINMASGSIKVKFPPEYRFLSTYHGIINEGYSGIFSFTSFGNRDCDIYCAQAFECTPVEDLTCNEPSCDTRIGEINFTIPTSDCTPVIFTDINNTTAYNVLTSTDYCFKIEDSAVSHTVDGIDYKQAQLEFSDGTVVTVGQSPPQAGQPPRNSRCTFIWDVDDITGEQHKFYFGEENTYINRGIDDHEYKITYVGLGSFVFRVERIGVEAPPPPTPTPIIYNIDIGFTAVTAITGTEGFATSIEVKRFEDSMTMGSCKVKYRTIEATALSGSDYVHTTGELEWYENDYSTRHITVPILNDSNYQDNNYFEVELYDPTYTSSKIIIYNNQVSFNLSPVKPNPVRVDIIDQTPAPIPPQIDFTIVNSQTVSAAEGDHAHIQVKRLESSTVSSACSATYDITSSGALSATPIIDYEDITGTLVWDVDDYSTHTVVIPFYSDGLTEGDEIFTFNITPISDDPNITYNALISSQSVVIQDVT